MFAMCDKSLTITIKRQAINRKEDYFRKVSGFLRAFAKFFFSRKIFLKHFLATFCFFQPRSSSYLANIIIDVRKKKKKFGIFSFWKKSKILVWKGKTEKKIKFKVKQGWGKTFIKRVVHDCKGVNDFVTLLPHC